ncbi:pyrokinin-1 receptor-like [Macrosteles quadrilineatus]|uniref:pyrokinin-1 receptor-like n=1 Tax=Macrosteles quadrilineatus TaxID=74068 RepID=UPI0023E2FCAA|nr:pyrokinin-1 receptor-like [Macrosteles quadrilineatus]
MTCLYAVILVSGVVGNISTCVVIARNKHMHTATNYYLFSLAISDLLLLLTGLPQEMYQIWYRYPYVFGEFFCRMTSFAQETSANATVLTITAFTVERYVAICHPFLSYTVSKLSRAIKFIIAIWVLALCLAVPQAIQFGVASMGKVNGTDDPEKLICTLKFEFIKHAFHISTGLFFVVPMTLITILYILIGLNLRRSRMLKRPSSTNQQQQSYATSRGHNHVVRMLVAVVVAFFICWAPFHCQRLLAVYASSTTNHGPMLVAVYNALTYVSGVLYFLSTCVNPFLYHTMSNKFRQAFKATLAQLCSRGKSSRQTRSYSILSRAGVPGTLVARSSMSCTTKEAVVMVGRGPRSVQPAYRSPAVPHVIGKKLRLNSDTISNSSLQDVDDGEYVGYELAHYMGELNRR